MRGETGRTAVRAVAMAPEKERVPAIWGSTAELTVLDQGPRVNTATCRAVPVSPKFENISVHFHSFFKQNSVSKHQYCCLVHGIWEAWSGWSECSETCNNGTQVRSRTCYGPFFGGDPCPGYDSKVRDCFLVHCPSTSNSFSWALSSWTETCMCVFLKMSSWFRPSDPAFSNRGVGMLHGRQ